MSAQTNRRRFLAQTGAALASGALLAACGRNGEDERARSQQQAARPIPVAAGDDGEWAEVRRQFDLSDDYIHMSALLIAAHPRPVREAIERYRRELDSAPALYLQGNLSRNEGRTLDAAAGYIGAQRADIALTDSTTMGIGLIYSGFNFRPGQEILTTEQDYFVTREALRLASVRTGARVRTISLYENIETVSADEIVTNIRRAITPATRLVALTWVHSSTGLKLPLRRIADALGEFNAGRDEAQRILFSVDGVHGFGIENVEMGDLGCDFFAAGCHKWLFGPRGTGIMWGRSEAWANVTPAIPSFRDDGVWVAWLEESDPPARTTGRRMTPGGFKPYEHQWALADAFAFQQRIGKARVAARTHQLAGQLKEGLAQMAHVRLRTPRSEHLSAGIVSFDIDGMPASAVVSRLRERGIVASAAPYAVQHVRLTPSIRNTSREIETALREIRALPA